MIDEFQSRFFWRGSEGQETSEVILVERPQKNHVDQSFNNTSEWVDDVTYAMESRGKRSVKRHT